MSSRLQILIIQAEGDNVLPAIEQFARAVAGTFAQPAAQPSAAEPRRVAAARPALPAANRDDEILEALKGRPMRVPEIADALCQDKRHVPALTQRLYSVMARLVKAKRVVKKGRVYSIR